jgi:probable addiction module antidote protein
MSSPTDYEQDLNEWLKDPEFAAGYLNAAIEEGDKDAILLAMRRVAQARGGMAAVAERAHVKRENLYRMLSKRGNPELRSLFNILHGMGLKLTVQPETTPDFPGQSKPDALLG